ncbi:MAG: 30S ribosomal protein S4 [Rickettsiaceae bacterium]|nr:30S ribosomal protein S4 [Rickettsiaceae bacterium]
MTKIIKAKYKASRRLGTSIWGNEKDPFHTKNYRPGQHGAGTRGKVSDYGLHLNAKQIVKNHYGRVTETQFRNTFKIASKMKGNTAENFAGLLEQRLDIIVYRLNFAPTIFAARQLVSHCHVRLNGKKVNIPSQRVKVGDIIEIKDQSKGITKIMESVQKLSRSVPEYLAIDPAKMSGELLRIPMISDIPYPFQPNFGKIVEYYSH